jgi:peptidoglycan/LPS O-acetylase OafA/YrhL
VTRIPALDGLRGLAVLLVVISHMDLPVFYMGGPVGVTVFFVLSGYLITRILTRQADNGEIRLAEFYKRRARRLLPALIMVVVAGACIFYQSDWWSYSWPALTYTSSFFMAAESGRILGYLSHTWSLAVEEHFYLLWPVVVAVIPASWRIRGMGLLAGTAVVWRLALYYTEPVHRMMNSTDGNAAALLIGCFIAVAASRLPAPNLRWGILSLLSLMSLSLMPFTAMRAPLSFLAIGLAAVIVHSAPAMKTLEARWLGWFGIISYGLYLWHPILMAMSDSWLMIPLSVLVAWASWRFVEKPILNGGRRPNVRIPVPVPLAA